MTSVMTPSELAADALVRDYLNGRSLPSILHGAVVWAAEKRLSSGKMLVLDETLRHDIDNQASTPPAPFKAPISRSDRKPVCALLQADDTTDEEGARRATRRVEGDSAMVAVGRAHYNVEHGDTTAVTD